MPGSSPGMTGAWLFSAGRETRPALVKSVAPKRGMARRQAQILVARAFKGTRAPCGAPSRRFRQRAPLQSRTVCPGSSSQLLAGTPSGPGGSSGAARVTCHVQAPQAPHPVPPSRRLAKAPLNWTKLMHHTGGSARGEKPGIHPRRPVIARLDRAIHSNGASAC